MYTLNDLKSEMRWLAESLVLIEQSWKEAYKRLSKALLNKASNNNQSKFQKDFFKELRLEIIRT